MLHVGNSAEKKIIKQGHVKVLLMMVTLLGEGRERICELLVTLKCFVILLQFVSNTDNHRQQQGDCVIVSNTAAMGRGYLKDW